MVMKVKSNYSTTLGLGGCETCLHLIFDASYKARAACKECEDYSNHTRKPKSRIDIIGQNGNDGEHYDELV